MALLYSSALLFTKFVGKNILTYSKRFAKSAGTQSLWWTACTCTLIVVLGTGLNNMSIRRLYPDNNLVRKGVCKLHPNDNEHFKYQNCKKKKNKIKRETVNEYISGETPIDQNVSTSSSYFCWNLLFLKSFILHQKSSS